MEIMNYRTITDDENKIKSENLSMIHNQFFVRNGEAWYRDFKREISCRNLTREIAVKQKIWKSPQQYGLDADNEMIDDDIFDDTMLDALQYGTDSNLGVLAMYYSAMWSFAEVRQMYINKLN